jgi:hypothetical protein
MKISNKILAVIFLLTSCIAALKAQVTPNIDPNAPDLKFVTDTIKFGTIEYKSDGWREMKFKNAGKSALVIDTLETECGCTTVEDNGKKTWPREPILPGKTSSLKVHYATERVGKFTKHVTVKSNGKMSSMKFVIMGEVLPEGIKVQSKVKKPIPAKTLKKSPKVKSAVKTTE